MSKPAVPASSAKSTVFFQRDLVRVEVASDRGCTDIAFIAALLRSSQKWRDLVRR